MPVTTLHLSSANSTKTSQGTHELRLEPGLQIPHDKPCTCYLHDLSFSNTVVNVSQSLYKNATVSLTVPVANKPDVVAEFVIPDGSYSIADIERELDHQIRAHPDGSSFTDSDPPFGATWADNETEWNEAVSIAVLARSSGTTALANKYVKLVTLEPDSTVNRVRVYSTFSFGTTNDLLQSFLGFDKTGLLKNEVATNIARVDRARAISVNVPSIVSGVYSSSGKLGGSQLALVPITAEIGRSQAFTASVPVKLRTKLSGSILDRVSFHLASEDGDRLELQGERFDAIVVLEW
jgi:hypothetical protein